jgi:hypothetical protein
MSQIDKLIWKVRDKRLGATEAEDPSATKEPIFILRAQDMTSAEIVEAWADRNYNLGGDPELIQEARRIARQMRAWKPRKLADA